MSPSRRRSPTDSVDTVRTYRSTFITIELQIVLTIMDVLYTAYAWMIYALLVP